MSTTAPVRPATRPTDPRRVGAAVVSAHGGSAATTVARIAKVPETTPTAAPSLAAVVVTARTTGPGLESVLALMARLPSATPALLVLTADAPLPLPPQARACLRLLRGRFAATITLPYVPAWRYRAPALATATKQWRRNARQIPTSLNQLITPQGEKA